MKYNYRKAIRLFIYGIAAIAGIVLLMGIMNVIFLIAGAISYKAVSPDYIPSTAVEEALTRTKDGYVLSEEMTREFEEMDQWAMLIDGDGRVVWSIRKPEEVGDFYTRADITRMSKWYLKGYPVRIRVWDDQIIVIGMQKDTQWKYTLEFSLSGMDFFKRTWIYVVLNNFALILILAFAFTRRWTKSRERARIEWIAGISHDIRTPLSMVMGYADVMEHDEALPEETRQQAAVIRHQSVVMKELISDLNLTSQLEYSMEALRKEKVRPAEVLRSVAASFLNDSLPGQLEIDVTIGQECERMTVKADRQLLVRAFRNLVNNSVKHGGQCGTVKIQISLWEEKGRCHIRFQDNGMGYSEETLRRLRSRKKNIEAQNIRGLEIIRKIIRAHGGKIRFGNCEEGGSYCLVALRMSSHI